MEKSNKWEDEISVKVQKGIDFLLKLSKKQRNKLLMLLKEVQAIQKSDLTTEQKTKEIKNTLWTKRSVSGKLLMGAFLGTITGLIIFGTGGIGIAGLGGAIGVWGWFAGTAGGVLVSSIIQNFEKKKN
ncbi:hypothetical protein [Bizionia myxarmorum]|uniref:Uncharacterized protein n=1 Tax=Bizionia myxarmorum TaxID=291186 RepID=A0A5D0QXX6_9FLAO|nr:hypothetical protein [Bizionia myxarmorum]TYB74052.1 hypothetical protein ES674_14975 [Bizionia myxarmorum]